ncbi:GSCOCG00012789001-RA-CDS, partial [Cotesia congregata]
VSILRCYKCCGYHHFAKDCQSEAVCRKCAGKHKEEECKSNLKKCVNC